MILIVQSVARTDFVKSLQETLDLIPEARVLCQITHTYGFPVTDSREKSSLGLLVRGRRATIRLMQTIQKRGGSHRLLTEYCGVEFSLTAVGAASFLLPFSRLAV